MEKGSGAVTISAALIIGAALLASGFMIKRSLDATTGEIAAVREALEAGAQAVAPPPRRAAAHPGRPDPSQRYEVDVSRAPAWGPASAKVTIVEFSDFQCPFCGRVWPTLQRIRAEYGDDVRLVFKHMPLGIHAHAEDAAVAAEAAHRQGKFWEMHNALFANQRDLSPERLAAHAKQIGLDAERYQKDVASPDVRKRVTDDLAEAEKLGVSGTPGFFVNGRFLSGAQPFESFKRLIDEELAKG
jgi:protein-disulfide isomerase